MADISCGVLQEGKIENRQEKTDKKNRQEEKNRLQELICGPIIELYKKAGELAEAG